MKRIRIMKLLVFTFICSLSMINLVQGQTEIESDPYNQVLPPSPSVAALAEYGQYQVGGSSGVPGISVPLLDVKGNTMSVPVSLNYHGAGNRVTDVASWVGQGWSLNAGGVVSRSVIGHEDGSGTGINNFYDQGFDPDDFHPNADKDDFDLFHMIAKQGWTADPDLFTFNVMGYSGQFFITPSGDICLFSDENLKISYTVLTGSIDKFIITPGNGMVFEFSEKENTLSSRDSGCGGNPSADNFVSAWHLTKITNEFEEFLFTYESETIRYDLGRTISESKNIGTGGSGLSTCYSYNSSSINRKKLTSIIGPFNTAVFTSNKARTDLDGGTALISIAYQDQLIALNTSFDYAGGNGWNINDTYSNYRLMLDGITVTAGTASPMNYQFIYNATNLPSRDSYSFDHYGYFNGKANITTLPPTTNYPTGANREVDPVFAKARVLEEIIYPTKGKTKFDWESNQYSYYDPNFLSPTQFTVNKNSVPAGVVHNQNFVIDATQSISIPYDIGINANTGETGEVNFKLTNTQTSAVIINENISQTGTLSVNSIGPGTYNLTVSNSDPPFDDLSFTVHYFYLNPQNITEYYGGLRIKRIDNLDADGSDINTKYFEYGDLSVSNKIIPEDYYKVTYGWNGTNFSSYGTRSSSSIYALSNSISYYTIKEYLGDPVENIGFTEYLYYTDQDRGGGAYGDPKQDMSWKRNLVREVLVYDELEELKHQTINEYEFIETCSFAGLKALYVKDHPSNVNFPPTGLEEIKWRVYDYVGSWPKLISEENDEEEDDTPIIYLPKVYDPFASKNTSGIVISDGVSIVTNYEYLNTDKHLNPGKITTIDSRGNSWENIALYPEDFSDTDIAFTSLKNKYFNKPIESIKRYYRKNSIGGYVINPKIVGGSSNVYNLDGDLVEVYQISNEDPIEQSSFIFGNGDNGSFSDPANYGLYRRSTQYETDPEVSIEYHEDGRVKEVTTRSLTTSYLWGYSSRYPVGKISNISYADLESILGTDKEIIENSNNSNLIEQKLSVLRGNLPATSFLEATLYYVGVGPYRFIDPNGIISTFEYDEFNRLIKAKDFDQNILQQFEYNHSDNN